MDEVWKNNRDIIISNISAAVSLLWLFQLLEKEGSPSDCGKMAAAWSGGLLSKGKVFEGVVHKGISVKSPASGKMAFVIVCVSVCVYVCVHEHTLDFIWVATCVLDVWGDTLTLLSDCLWLCMHGTWYMGLGLCPFLCWEGGEGVQVCVGECVCFPQALPVCCLEH